MYTIKEIMKNRDNKIDGGYDKAYDMMELNYLESSKSEERTLRYSILIGDGPFMDYAKSRKILLEKFLDLKESPRYVVMLYVSFYTLHYGPLSGKTIKILNYLATKDSQNAYRYDLCLSEHYSWCKIHGLGNEETEKHEIKYALKSFKQKPTVASSLKLFKYFFKNSDYQNAYITILEGLKSIKKFGVTYENTDWTEYMNYIDEHVSCNSNPNCIEELKESLEICIKKLNEYGIVILEEK